jgi:hypothetical protein
MAYVNGKEILFSAVVNGSGNGGGGAVDLSNIPEVESIEKPKANAPTVVKYNGEIYILAED